MIVTWTLRYISSHMLALKLCATNICQREAMNEVDSLLLPRAK